MPVKNFPVEIVGVEYVCDSCGQGTMIQDGSVVLMTSPPKFQHKCNHCGAEQSFTEKYPTYQINRKLDTSS